MSECNVYCRTQPALGHWANETAPAAGFRGGGGKGGGRTTTKSGLVFFPLSRAQTHIKLSKKKKKERREKDRKKDKKNPQKTGPQ